MLGMGFTQTTGKEGNWPSEVTHARIWDIGATWKDIHVAPDQFDWSRLDEVLVRWKAWVTNTLHMLLPLPLVGPLPIPMPPIPHLGWDQAQTLYQEISTLLGNHSQQTYHNVTRVAFTPTKFGMNLNLPDFMYPYDDKNRNKLAQMTKDASRIIKGNDPKPQKLVVRLFYPALPAAV